MPFNRTDPADLAALKSEVNDDPIGMGYDPTGNTQQLLKLLNDPANNVGGETTVGDLTPRILWEDVIEPVDLTPGGQFSEGDSAFVQLLFELTEGEGADIGWARPKLEAVFAANTTTGGNLRGLSRALSRAEVLFGVDTVITREDWLAARDS